MINRNVAVDCCRVCGPGHSLAHVKYIRGEETGGDLALYKCKACGSFFSRTKFSEQTQSDINQGSIDGYLNNKNYVLSRVDDILSYSLEKRWLPSNEANFLDIGCGVGWSLVAAEKKGFTASGVEPMINAAMYANRILKINVINSLFKSSLFNVEQFDFIMMDQVLEHVPNPVEMLINVFHVLKPGGVFFLSVPPIDWSRIMVSISYQFPIRIAKSIENTKYIDKSIAFAKKYDAFCCPEGHINYFSTRAISVLAKYCNAEFLEQYHMNKHRAKYFSFLKLSTGSFFLRKY